MIGGEISPKAWWTQSLNRPGFWFVMDRTRNDSEGDFYCVVDDFGNLVRVPF